MQLLRPDWHDCVQLFLPLPIASYGSLGFVKYKTYLEYVKGVCHYNIRRRVTINSMTFTWLLNIYPALFVVVAKSKPAHLGRCFIMG